MAINSKTNTPDESEVLAKLAALGMNNKKGEDIVLLDLRQLPTAPARFFVICSGNVPSHVNAIADGVFETVKKATGQNPRKMDGYDNAEWVLIDYFDVMVHVFQKEKRAFYNLETLWADGIRMDYAPDEETAALMEGKKEIKRTKAASAKAKTAKLHRATEADLLADEEPAPAKRTYRITLRSTAKLAGRVAAGKGTAGKGTAGRNPAGKEVAGKEVAGRKPAGRAATGKAAAGRKPAGKETAGRKPAGRKPATGTTAKKPASPKTRTKNI